LTPYSKCTTEIADHWAIQRLRLRWSTRITVLVETHYPPDTLTSIFEVAIGTVCEPAGTMDSMEFTAAITHEDPWYVARCLDVEVASQGETAEEALANLKEALELYFEDEVLPDGLEPPIIATLRLTA
jgi:predicted RNase H-like HicB family nuclease